jgi:hypothetical protein
VNVEQSTRIAVAFARQTARAPISALCGVCVDVLAVEGAGITLMSGGHAGPVCVSNPRIAALEDLQFMLGEGPCQDAYRSGLPVHAPRLDQLASVRWPSFIELAQRTGIGAVFAYPLSVNGAKVGVMTLYQSLVGELTDAQQSDSVAMSEVLTETVLSLQAEAPVGNLGSGLDSVVAYRAQIHQAAGMVAVQLQVPVAEALVRLRGHAFAAGRSLGAVASDIVSRRLRLTDDRDPAGEVDPSNGE